jgi:hypothetical protein
MREPGIETDLEKISASWINQHLIDGDDNPRVENVLPGNSNRPVEIPAEYG